MNDIHKSTAGIHIHWHKQYNMLDYWTDTHLNMFTRIHDFGRRTEYLFFFLCRRGFLNLHTPHCCNLSAQSVLIKIYREFECRREFLLRAKRYRHQWRQGLLPLFYSFSLSSNLLTIFNTHSHDHHLQLETHAGWTDTFVNFSSPNTTVLTRLYNKSHVLYTNMTQTTKFTWSWRKYFQAFYWRFFTLNHCIFM
jgi:hypothetical protein